MLNYQENRLRLRWKENELKKLSTTIFLQEDMPLSDQSNCRLPVKMKTELMNGLCKSEIQERISYFKERSTFYKMMSEDPKSNNVEKEFFDKCCQYHVTKLLVWETQLEKLGI